MLLIHGLLEREFANYGLFGVFGTRLFFMVERGRDGREGEG